MSAFGGIADIAKMMEMRGSNNQCNKKFYDPALK
jgi:hypothetical protein